MGHEAVNHQAKGIHQFRERGHPTCFGNCCPSLLTGWTGPWFRHGCHDKSVQGIQVGSLLELRAVRDGIGIFRIEGFALRREPSTFHEQCSKMLELAQCHPSQRVWNCSSTWPKNEDTKWQNVLGSHSECTVPRIRVHQRMMISIMHRTSTQDFQNKIHV